MALANSSLQQWKNPEISVNKPVCVLSQPLDFLPFLRLSRLCKSSTGALYPASAAEISTSSQLCARLSAVCYSQELAGNQFKMFHIQTPPRNSWISPFSLPSAGTGAFNCFALSARNILSMSQLPATAAARHAPAQPRSCSSSHFLALQLHHLLSSAHAFPCPALPQEPQALPSTSPKPGVQ